MKSFIWQWSFLDDNFPCFWASPSWWHHGSHVITSELLYIFFWEKMFKCRNMAPEKVWYKRLSPNEELNKTTLIQLYNVQCNKSTTSYAIFSRGQWIFHRMTLTIIGCLIYMLLLTNWILEHSLRYTLGKKGCYTPGWCVFFVIISISSVREV